MAANLNSSKKEALSKLMTANLNASKFPKEQVILALDPCKFQNVKIDNSPYKIGTLVMVKNAKKSLKKSLMEPEFVGPYKIKVIKSNDKVDLAHPTDKELTVIKEFRNVPISMLKLFQGGVDVDTKDDLKELDRIHSITLNDKSGGNVVIIIN
jgi:hypothetical protein